MYKIKSENLEQEKSDFLQQIKTLEERVNTQTAVQERFKQSLQELDMIKQKNEVLQNDNQKLKLELGNYNHLKLGLEKKLEKIENELKESLDLNQFQADKIALIKSKHNKAEKPTVNVSPSSRKGRIYFKFNKDKYIKAPKKAENISLELDSVNNTWIIIIDSKVPFIEKNKALRLARSLPVSGIRLPNGTLIGKGSRLTIIGE